MIRRAQPWLGTLVEITADGDQAGLSAAFAQIAQVHGLMSFHDAASDIARFNRAAAGTRLELHDHTMQVLQLAEQLRLETDGMFNIACAPRLVENGLLPAPAAETVLYQPGQALMQWDADGSLCKLASGWIDVGGIAKGYAVDLAVAALQLAGAQAGCVNAGGDLRVFGLQDWPVSLRDPRQPQRLLPAVQLRAEAMATSATYFSRRMQHGQHVSALLDGRDGRSILSSSSISVRAPSCVLADALTKVVMASADPHHPALTQWQATALII
ncbi:FAD:protein FMN transferase [Duganella qianjiadongensis]|uniref:FAD:protein FMN transferase n=1 Tax=Duganella qianjiadongensis TaxID=2692176 RepID=A0ABW9VII4_9BURK|nr:FAD:protein FMN transferase [Duganella qianjiadongensis]MYM39418.1 FAD:protein FMN transferase [Duganella qianjiadongensis]